jgi:formate/nitrite transporter FocA (FNT family)
MGRWQLSTFTLAPVIWLLAVYGITNSWIAAFVGNVIGSLIFFWVDKLIFKSDHYEVWQTKGGKCDNCNVDSEYLWRLVRAPGYNRMGTVPIFLCMECSKRKTEELRSRGISVKGRSK